MELSALLLKLKTNKWLIFEVSILSAILVIIWVLLSLPVVFFYLPKGGSNNITSNTTNGTQTGCDAAITYTGSVCRESLLSLASTSQCDSDSDDNLLVIRDAAPAATEILGLLASASPQCAAAARPLLCQITFVGVCDKEGNLYQPTSGECNALGDGVCQRDFELAQTLGFNLPDCSALPASVPERNCSASDGSGQTNPTLPPSSSLMTTMPPMCNLTCRENFFCDEQSMTCAPHCPNWNLFAPSAALALDVLVSLSAALGAVAGIGVIVVSILRRKQVYTFPSVLVIYETISFLVLIFFQLVTFMDRTLYCSSPNLSQSLTSATPFCILTGMVTSYIPLQVNFFWVSHMAILYWTISFPLKANTLETKKRFKILHIVLIIVGLIAPSTPVVGLLIDDIVSDRLLGRLGFGISSFPPILCVGLNSSIVFHLAILPSVILMIIGTSCLVLMIFTIHRKYGIMKSIRSGSSFSLSTAEKKLLIVFVYYIFMQVIVFVYFSQTQQLGSTLAREIGFYFSCEQRGYDPNRPCDRSTFETLINPPLAVLAFTVALLVPIVSFVFVVDFSMFKQKVKELTTRWMRTSDMSDHETHNGRLSSKINNTDSQDGL